MAIPSVVAAGTASNVTTAAATPGIPAGTASGHLMLLFVESQNQVINPMLGWGNVGVGVVQQATTTPTALTVRWRIAGASEAPPSVTAAGTQDHLIARIVTVAGADQWAPVNVAVTGVDNTSSTAVSVPSGSTTVADCLVFAAFSTGTDVTSTAMVASWVNASLASPAVTELCDNWTLSGGGGGFGVAAGGLAVAGAYQTTTATLTTANTKALLSFAVKPLGVPRPDQDQYDRGPWH